MLDALKFALGLLAIGMGVVFTALVSLQWFVNGITWLDRGLGRLFGTQVSMPVEESPDLATTEASLEITDEEVAVIAAAVTAAVGGPVTVHHVKMIRDSSQENWSRVGRLDIMRSHNPAQK